MHGHHHHSGYPKNRRNGRRNQRTLRDIHDESLSKEPPHENERDLMA
jgi:hypothetical protein